MVDPYRHHTPPMQYNIDNPPFVPNVDVHEVARPYLVNIAAEVANQAGKSYARSAFTRYFYNLISENGFANRAYADVVKFTCDLAALRVTTGRTRSVGESFYEICEQAVNLFISVFSLDNRQLTDSMSQTQFEAAKRNDDIYGRLMEEISIMYNSGYQYHPGDPLPSYHSFRRNSNMDRSRHMRAYDTPEQSTATRFPIPPRRQESVSETVQEPVRDPTQRSYVTPPPVSSEPTPQPEPVKQDEVFIVETIHLVNEHIQVSEGLHNSFSSFMSDIQVGKDGNQADPVYDIHQVIDTVWAKDDQILEVTKTGREILQGSTAHSTIIDFARFLNEGSQDEKNDLNYRNIDAVVTRRMNYILRLCTPSNVSMDSFAQDWKECFEFINDRYGEELLRKIERRTIKYLASIFDASRSSGSNLYQTIQTDHETGFDLLTMNVQLVSYAIQHAHELSIAQKKQYVALHSYHGARLHCAINPVLDEDVGLRFLLMPDGIRYVWDTLIYDTAEYKAGDAFVLIKVE